MFRDQPPSDMKQSPIYSSLLFILKHCVKSTTAAKPAEAMDGSPRDAGGGDKTSKCSSCWHITAIHSPASSGITRPKCSSVSKDFATEVRLNIVAKSGAELGKYTGRGKLNDFSEIHGTSFHGLSIEYLTSFSHTITKTIKTPKAIKYSPLINASNLKVTVHPPLYSTHNRD